MPAALGLVAALVVGGVFAAAALGKLVDRAGTRQAAVEFGSPEWLAGTLTLVLPVAELAVAGALLVASTRTAGAVAALGFLCVFSVAIAVGLVRGRAPDCHCFGHLHSAPASWKTLARNGALAAVAAVALVEGSRSPGAFGWIGRLAPAEILALVTGVVAAVLLVAGGRAFLSLLRSHGRVLVRLDTVERTLREAGLGIPDETLSGLGIDPGTPAPAFTVETVSGGRVSLDDLLEPRLPLLLVFTSPGCGPCRALLPALAGWQHEHAGALTLAVVSGGDVEATRHDADEHGLDRMLVDEDLGVYEAYQASLTPSAVLVSPDGLIAAYVASGYDQIEGLVERALAPDETEQRGLPIGAAAPELDLRDLEGERISLADPGRDTLVLFWNPGCGFCSAMRGALHAWERTTEGGSLRLLVVSSGDAEALRADGFRSTVVLDPEYAASAAFHAAGTPMAVLVDRDGRVASALVVGADAVFALAVNHEARPSLDQMEHVAG